MRRTPIAILLTFTLVGGATVDCSGKSTPPPSDVVTAPASADDSRVPSADAPPSASAERPAPSGPRPEETTSDPCASVRCRGEEYCDLQTVTCVRAPCLPVPTCVAGMHPCAATTCVYGSRCESHDGKGVCIPMASKDAGVPCGRATCEPGMVCCNASCGICTPPDGMCTQQACD
ncbi:MAG TPA: hypothetical protein VM925_03980 [Labilithrix sp.]|nr:hypothetical protein [Labilithrix sp.]